MKSLKTITVLLFSSLILSACVDPTGNRNPDSEDQNGQSENAQTNVIKRNQLGGDYYIPVLTDEGGYATSENRGVTLNLNSGINISLFEKDLMRLSQEQFSTDTYMIQEGQYLTSDMVTSWLGREANPDTEGMSEDAIAEKEFMKGLNPAQSAEFNPSENVYNHDVRQPNYLQSILEFDFYKEAGSEYPDALSIGLALNSADYYQTEIGGPVYTQNIPDDKILKQGQSMASEIVRRVRQLEGLSDIPIFVGLYKQSARDELGGGVYIATGTSTNGSTAIQSWETIKEQRLIFPLQGKDSSEGNAFANFQSEVEKFFPNLSGVTGEAHYIDEQLVELKINIVTQFYGKTEMIAFSQYLKQSAETFLPQDLDVEIIVESTRSVEAFLKKDRTEAEYFAHVFN